MINRLNRLNRVGVLIQVVMLMIFLAACSSVPGMKDSKSFADMSMQEKSLYLMKTYNKQYDQYVSDYDKAMGRKEGPTDVEVEMLQAKYDALNELYPYIKMYMGYAEEGVLPPEDVEAACLEALGRVLNL